jgi:hypothetical protein
MIMVLLDNVQIVASNKRTFSIGKYAFNVLMVAQDKFVCNVFVISFYADKLKNNIIQ